MFTDLVGFTARAQRDEPQALRLLEEHRRLLRPRFEEFHGREIKTIGDAFLVEFDSALNATGCAVAIQKSLYERNLREPGDSIDVRVGIHLGEISHDAGDIHGDAVNVASRIYPLADPGGICLSEPVFAQVRGRLDLTFEKLPPTPLKNVTYPVDLFRALLPWSERGLSPVLPWTDREAEMDAVQKTVAASVRGESGLLLLVGEVGIGKTRLADEALERARKSGVRVMRGRCAPGELSSPYAPWVEAFRMFVREATAAQLYRVLGTQARELARLVPEVVEKLGALPPSISIDPEMARAQFLEGILQLVDRLASEGPLVLFLDDLHWADPASSALLRHLVPRLKNRPVLFLGAYRKAEEEENRELRETLAELHREHLESTVTLGRLEAGHVGSLIAQMFHTEQVSDEFTNLVHSRTGGNPLLIEEVLRALVKDRVIYWSGSGWERRPVDQIEIPEGVKEIILQRLRRYDEKTLDLLRIASVFGYEFDFDLLQEISGEEETKLLDLVEGLIRGRLIQEVGGAHGRSVYVFADHPTRDVLYDQVSLVRRRRTHLRIAQALERQGGKLVRDRAAELAHHFLQGNDVAKAREYSFRAAERAASVFAHSESRGHYRTALELAEEAGDEDARAEILERLAWETNFLGLGAESFEHHLAAADVYGKLGRRQEQARALSAAATLAREALSDVPRALRLARESIKLLEGTEESPSLVQAYTSLAVLLASTGAVPEARELLVKAQALGQKFHLVDEVSTSLQFLANTAPWSKKAEGVAQSTEAARIAERGDAVRTSTKLTNFGIMLGFTTSDIPGALEVMERARKEAERRGQAQYAAFARGARASLLAAAGRWPEARREAEAVLAASGGRGRTLGDAMALSALAGCEATTGDLGRANELEERARKLWEGMQASTSAATVEAWIVERSLDDGREDTEGEARVEALLASVLPNERTLVGVRQRATLLLAVAEARLRHGNIEGTRPLVEELEVLARELDEPWAAAYRDRVVGQVCLAQGLTPEAVERLRNGAEFALKAGLPFEEGKTRQLLGGALVKAGRNEEARAEFDRAIGIFERLGAGPAAAHVRQRRDQIPG